VTTSETNEATTETPATVSELEREGDIAADFIEELLDICDLDGDLDIDARNGRAYVSVVATEAGGLERLSRPDAVAALQELTRLAVQNKTGAYSRLIMDVGGSREAREVELERLVATAAERIDLLVATVNAELAKCHDEFSVRVVQLWFDSVEPGPSREMDITHTVAV
jgi:spoIIIJ-associated protein